MKKFILIKIVLLLSAFFTINSANAQNIPYKKSVTLKVGQSVVLKGVRSRDCGDVAEPWTPIKARLPKSKLGSFSNGGEGTVKSRSCKKRVAARGILFTAEKVGKERLLIFSDPVRITVK